MCFNIHIFPFFALHYILLVRPSIWKWFYFALNTVDHRTRWELEVLTFMQLKIHLWVYSWPFRIYGFNKVQMETAVGMWKYWTHPGFIESSDGKPTVTTTFIEKKSQISGPAQFKPILIKGQLYIPLVRIARTKSPGFCKSEKYFVLVF